MVLTDVILESFRAMVLLILVGYLWNLGKKKGFIVTTGWRFIQFGFLLILFGSFLRATGASHFFIQLALGLSGR